MKYNETFSYSESTGLATCRIKYEDQEFIGKAKCHPDDMEFATEFVGCEIARHRAVIKVFKHIIKEDRIAIKTLQDFYNSIAASRSMRQNYWLKQKFLNEIASYQEDIKTAQSVIDKAKIELVAYTTGKDHFYKILKQIRNRAADKTNQSI